MRPIRVIWVGALLLFWSVSLVAQKDDELSKTIRENDSLFWIAYNNCDMEGMHRFIADDVEFYHDKGGAQFGWDTFKATTEKNLCSRKDWKLRRAAIAESLVVFPMEKNATIYGAILSGEHNFYLTENDQPEYQTGSAKFTHLWLLKDGQWKMSRILSYDHGAPKYENKRKEITLSDAKLKQYVRKFKSAQGVISVTKEEKGLSLSVGKNKYRIYPESETIFFYKERDLTFEFVKKDGKIASLRIVENGKLVEEDPKI